MKKYFLSFNLLLLLFGAGWTADAAKRYRYIKREHGVRFQGNMPMNLVPFSMSLDLKGAYSYNWKGMFEFGPYFGLNSDMGATGFALKGYSAGLSAEYNFIKNRGKRKLIPAAGLSFGIAGAAGKGILGSVGVHSALKYFVGKRTPFIVSLGYKLQAPFMNILQMNHQLDISMGFAYYFDFY